MRAPLRDLCECQAELCNIAMTAEVSFVSSFRFVIYWVAIVGSLCECQAELSNTAEITEVTVPFLVFFMYIKIMQTSIAKTLLLNEKKM